MTDYDVLLDPEMHAFIERSNSPYDPDTAKLPMADQRRAYDRLCVEFHHGYPKGVTAHDAPIAGVPCRHYHPANARAGVTILYFHGGGFVLGGLFSHDDICAELSVLTGRPLISVDYRLAPEHLYPAQETDTLAVLDAVLADSADQVILAGDSAGGYLAAYASAARRGPRLAGQVLIYPPLSGDHSTGSGVTHAEAPMLTRADMDFYRAIRFPDGVRPADFVDPMNAPDLSNLPPTVIFSAECDPLADDGPEFARRVVAAGGQAQCFEEKGLVHGYLRARHMSSMAAASFARIAASLTALADAAEAKTVADRSVEAAV